MENDPINTTDNNAATKPALPQRGGFALSEWVGAARLHEWWELSYAQYLTVPRSVMQSMPDEWQWRMAALLNELDEKLEWRPGGGLCYRVTLSRLEEQWSEETQRCEMEWGGEVVDPMADYQRGRRRLPLKAAAPTRQDQGPRRRRVPMSDTVPERFPASPGYVLPAVGGRRIATSNAEFERKCLVMLGEEQKKLSPDNALIDLLCESVRIAREYSDAMNDGNPFTEADGWLGAEGHNDASERLAPRQVRSEKEGA